MLKRILQDIIVDGGGNNNSGVPSQDLHHDQQSDKKPIQEITGIILFALVATMAVLIPTYLICKSFIKTLQKTNKTSSDIAHSVVKAFCSPEEVGRKVEEVGKVEEVEARTK